MTVQLRPYQLADKIKIKEAWDTGHQCVLFRADTGYGKTAVLANLVEEHRGAAIVIAHRAQLVSQISLMLARYGVRHNVIASKKDCKAIAAMHVKKTGRNYYDPGAPTAVASVDTLLKRDGLDGWAAQVTLAIVDEGHHVIIDNKWGEALALFTNRDLRILLPTATPKRADGRGLGRHADGLADIMVEGPLMAWLIDEGYLTNYDVATVNSHMEELLGKVAESGDWSVAAQRSAAENSTIIGDVVTSYLAYSRGRPAIVFSPDVKTAKDQLAEYRSSQVRAELITGDTDPDVRWRIISQLETGEIDVMIAVDIVSEGFDLPAVSTGILSRPTASLAVYMQQCGRVLRPLDTPEFRAACDPITGSREARLAAIAASAKPRALLIDHVGNIRRHDPPDKPRAWSLNGSARRGGGGGGIPSRVCLNISCGKSYERVLLKCPFCATPAPPPAERSSPEMVDGDMVLLSQEVLDAMRGRIAAVDIDLEEYRRQLAASGLPGRFIMRNAKSKHAQQEAQTVLREVMRLWGGQLHAAGRADQEIQRTFFFRFGVDVMTAQSLPADEAYDLMNKILVDPVLK